MGRKEQLETASQDYERLESQFMATKLYIQNKMLGVKDEDMRDLICAGGNYLLEARRVCFDDLNLMFAWACNRECRGIKKHRESRDFFGNGGSNSNGDLPRGGRSKSQVRYQIGALHYAFDLPTDLREHGTQQLQTLDEDGAERTVPCVSVEAVCAATSPSFKQKLA